MKNKEIKIGFDAIKEMTVGEVADIEQELRFKYADPDWEDWMGREE